jgi:hypothetical protein
VPHAKNMVGCTNSIILMTVVSIIPKVLLPKGIRAQKMHKTMDILIRTV